MDFQKIAKITRLDKLSVGRAFLIAAAVTWSTFSTSLGNPGVAEAARMLAMGGAALSSNVDMTRLGGIPYRNNKGELVVSGSAADDDYLLTGCQPQAQVVYDVARASEPAITLDMLEIADELGTSMEGLEYSVKTASSIKSKIERKSDKAIKMGINPKTDAQYVMETKDLIRYTQIVPHDEMAEMTESTISLLTDKGYTVEKLDNKYLKKDGRYKAIHLDIANDHGIRFEMQIHSPETLKANKETHGMYEEWRHVDTPQERKDELFQAIKSAYDALPLPKGIMAIQNFSMV